jgi:hypothetical protein
MPTGGIKYIPVGLLRKERRRPVSTNAGRQHLENPLLLYVMQLALRNMEPLHFTKLYYMWHCRQCQDAGPHPLRHAAKKERIINEH